MVGWGALINSMVPLHEVLERDDSETVGRVGNRACREIFRDVTELYSTPHVCKVLAGRSRAWSVSTYMYMYSSYRPEATTSWPPCSQTSNTTDSPHSSAFFSRGVILISRVAPLTKIAPRFPFWFLRFRCGLSGREGCQS